MTIRRSWEDARIEGRTEGRIETLANGVLTVLRVRGLPVSAAARRRILAERDPQQLTRWHEQAILAESVDDLFAGRAAHRRARPARSAAATPRATRRRLEAVLVSAGGWKPMARNSDRDRVLNVLAESNGLSNARIKQELNLGDDRYETVRDGLIEEGLAEKYVCRGGGLRLTKKGEREISPDYDEKSSVDKEQDLYEPLVQALEREAPESLAFSTASLRKRGQWQNPDVTQISIIVYPYLRRRQVLLTTYEVKQWKSWDVSTVFEAASHARFAHEGYVVLEWPERAFSISDSKLVHVVRECQRFGIGLGTLEPYYNQYRFHVRLEPVSHEPSDADVEEWLAYAMERRDGAAKRFQELMDTSNKKL